MSTQHMLLRWYVRPHWLNRVHAKSWCRKLRFTKGWCTNTLFNSIISSRMQRMCISCWSCARTKQWMNYCAEGNDWQNWKCSAIWCKSSQQSNISTRIKWFTETWNWRIYFCRTRWKSNLVILGYLPNWISKVNADGQFVEHRTTLPQKSLNRGVDIRMKWMYGRSEW